jgi:glycosyltransferase involved in cell wall biosynthesis
MNPRAVKVTVIMACYNSSVYLDEAVRSVLNQTRRDLELILIDDCSTDKTIEIAKHYQAEDSRVSILSLPEHSGPAVARNAGVRAARGEWLGILDSDDIAMPSRFEEQMKLAESDKGLAMITSNAISINDQGHVIKEHRYPTRHRDLAKRLFSLQAFPPHSSTVFRREEVQRLSAFNPRYAPSEDADLCLRLLEVGKVGSVDKTLVKIRKHALGISNSDGGMLQIRLGFLALAAHFLRIRGHPDPSVGDDEVAWQEFAKWGDRRMSEEGFFERRNAWADARAAFYKAKNRVNGTARCAYHLLRSGHAGALIWERILGSSLPKRLAGEWMMRSCSRS